MRVCVCVRERFFFRDAFFQPRSLSLSFSLPPPPLSIKNNHLDIDVELLDTLQRELVALDQNAHGLVHELARDLKSFRRQRRRKDADLQLGREQLEDVVDLVLEAAREHLVGFVEDEHLDGVGAEGAAAEHVVDAAGRADDNVDAACLVFFRFFFHLFLMMVRKKSPLFLFLNSSDAVKEQEETSTRKREREPKTENSPCSTRVSSRTEVPPTQAWHLTWR